MGRFGQKSWIHLPFESSVGFGAEEILVVVLVEQANGAEFVLFKSHRLDFPHVESVQIGNLQFGHSLDLIQNLGLYMLKSYDFHSSLLWSNFVLAITCYLTSTKHVIGQLPQPINTTFLIFVLKMQWEKYF
jgi:hypothetical protein